MSDALKRSIVANILVSQNTTKQLTIYWHTSKRVHMVRYQKMYRVVIFRNATWQLANLEMEQQNEENEQR